MKATNEFVLVIRDKTDAEKNGLIIPGSGRTKPHVGTIHSVGAMVKDHNIKSGKGKKCLFHGTVGFEIEFDGQVYLVLQDREIIAMV